MAITKILYRNGGLAQAIQYITNPDKTDQCVLVDHFNCDPGFAYQQMMNTKRRFHKTDGRQCYHIINNGPRKTVAELEEQSKTGTPISLLELAQAVQREDAEKRRAQQPVRREKSGEKPSILAKLKTPSVADTKSVKSAPKRSAEREL